MHCHCKGAKVKTLHYKKMYFYVTLLA
ncbi:hypothetical protein ACJIZ3_012754 [Penstemon smallii]|uniref:Uncharacterized protein n=1 Tax=Penstemon smallii TaxID=265156 RepID=A0ABD3UP29_9LAMI